MDKSTQKQIPDAWVETTLGEVCELIGDGLHGTPKYSESGDYYFFNGRNIKNGKLLVEIDTKKLNRVEYEKYKKDLKERTILMSINGTVGNLAKYKNEKCILGKSAAFLNVKNNTDTDFIYYLMLDKKFQYDISKNANGSTIKNVSLKQLRDYSFSIPSLNEQKAIVDILLSFDNKIELLREQNKTLEKTAQTIFQEWFGKYKVGDELPDGWRVGSIGDMVKLQSGYSFKSENYNKNGIYGLVTIRNVQDGIFIGQTKDRLNEIPANMPKHCILHNGDLLISLTGNVGRICQVIGEKYLLNQRVAKIDPINIVNHGFVYLLFKSGTIINAIHNISSGSAQQNLSPIQAMKIRINIPNNIVLENFSFIANNFLTKILKNKLQIIILSKSRNSLISKLMNNEIKVNKL